MTPHISRQPNRRRSALAVLLVCGIACGTTPSEPVVDLDPADLNILFIGNSLTYFNDMPGMLQAMLDSAGVGPALVESLAFPNVGLEDHWNTPFTRSAIAQPGWDFVIMQQGPSATEGRPSLLEFGQRFAAEIRAAGAVPGFYMVWPSNARAFDYDGVSESYQMAADSADALLFPAGEAWRVAWDTDSTIALYGSDQFHPSRLGSYLAALVIFEQVAGRSADGLPSVLQTREGGRVTIPEATATILQSAATEANRRFAR